MTTKETIKAKLFSIQNQIITDLKERIKLNFEMVTSLEGDTLDIEDYSHINESVDMDELFMNQLIKSEQEKKVLDSIDFSPKTSIQEGSIVLTSQFAFIIGIATLPFQIDQNNYIGISTDSPIYSAMYGKKEGETFSFANNTYTIKEII